MNEQFNERLNTTDAYRAMFTPATLITEADDTFNEGVYIDFKYEIAFDEDFARDDKEGYSLEYPDQIAIAKIKRSDGDGMSPSNFDALADRAMDIVGDHLDKIMLADPEYTKIWGQGEEYNFATYLYDEDVHLTQLVTRDDIMYSTVKVYLRGNVK
jgi:hypothetical protein